VDQEWDGVADAVRYGFVSPDTASINSGALIILICPICSVSCRILSHCRSCCVAGFEHRAASCEVQDEGRKFFIAAHHVRDIDPLGKK